MSGQALPIPAKPRQIPAKPRQTPVAQALDLEKACDECRGKPAVRFCLCSTPVRKYCEQCDTTHYQKAQSSIHSTYPIAAFRTLLPGRANVELFRRKQEYIKDFKLRIGEELTNFDAFMKEVEGGFDQGLAEMKAKKEATLENLKARRGELAAALYAADQEIEAKRYVKEFEVTTVLDGYVASGYLTRAEYKSEMFAGKLELGGITPVLDGAVWYDFNPTTLQAEIGLIPLIKDNILSLFHPTTFAMTQIPLSQQTPIDQSTAYCYAGTYTLLCCGGQYKGYSHNEVYEVNVKSGRVDKVRNMNSFRSYMGIWCTKQQVFVFGGDSLNNTHVNSAEKYGLAGKSWDTLPSSMPNTMYLPSVCEHSTGLYLSGNNYDYQGCQAAGTSILFFSLETEAFHQLRFDTFFVGTSLLCCLGDELYYIHRETFEKANLARGPEGVKFAVEGQFKPIFDGNYWQCCPMKFRKGAFVNVVYQDWNPKGLFTFSPADNLFALAHTFPQ